MRFSRRLTSTTVLLAVVGPLLCTSTAHAGGHGAGVPGSAVPRKSFGADCRISVSGSRVTAFCHNPWAETDRVRLHVECVRWWDLDSDGRAVAADPAWTVRLTARCWKEVDSAWVSHHRF